MLHISENIIITLGFNHVMLHVTTVVENVTEHTAVLHLHVHFGRLCLQLPMAAITFFKYHQQQ